MTDIVIDLQEGKIRGKLEKDYRNGQFFSFLGVPYAKAPVGSLRFKAPEQVEPWRGVLNCTREGPECPSIHMFTGFYVGKENNCLNLNVYTKQLGEGLRKPVMVYIHGGGFVFGSNKRELLGPEFLMTQDIVLVVINYRLGVLGFLAIEDPSLGVPGNAGLKDQVMALKWVQRNIKNFGGDPNNVTIFGESAGGACVHLLMLSPMAKGLFHKAIAQSGVATCPFARGYHNGKEFGQHFNYEEKQESAILEKLRKEPVKNLIYTQLKQNKEFVVPRFQRNLGYVIENGPDAFLSEEPEAIMKSGNYNQVPLIIGYTSNEGLLFEICKIIFKDLILPGDFELELPFSLNLKLGSEKSLEAANKLKSFYFQDREYREDSNEIYELRGDCNFKYDIWNVASILSSSNRYPVYFYRFDFKGDLNLARKAAISKSSILFLASLVLTWVPQIKSLFQLEDIMPKRSAEGAAHGDDNCLLFQSSVHPYVEEGSMEDDSVQKMVQLWTNFARTGNPTPSSKERYSYELEDFVWEPMTPESFKYLDLKENLKMAKNPDDKAMQFWKSIYEEYKS